MILALFFVLCFLFFFFAVLVRGVSFIVQTFVSHLSNGRDWSASLQGPHLTNSP